MSSQKFAQVIDCGATHVSAGFFSGRDGSVTLEGFYSEPIGCDFSNDEEWISAVFQAAEAIHRQRKFRGSVSIILPGHLLLTKFLKIPHVAKSKRDQIVRFEAQQNIPFPLNEVVWDYEVVADDGAEFEVALVAVKLDVVDRLCSEISRLGVEVQMVEPSCMAQYNGFSYTHAGTEENVLVANLGGKSSNLLFISESGFFVRNISLAGNALTQALAQETGQSLADAEAAKWERVAAAFEGGDTQGLEHHLDAFLRRLVMETTRSIVNFRRQSGEEKVDRVYLTGGGALVPGVVEHLGEKLKLPVEYYSPLDYVELGAEVDSDFAAGYQHHVGELLGCALHQLGEPRTHFNLLPPQIARQIHFRKKKPFLMAAAVVLVGAAYLPIYSAGHTAFVFEDKIAELDARLNPLQQLYRDYTGVRDRIEETRNQIAALKGLGESRANWIDFFGDLQQRLGSVEDVWVERLEIVRSNGDARARAGSGGIFGGQRETERRETGGEVRLRLVGRMLDRENPLERASPDTRARVSALFESILESDYISSKRDEVFDTSTHGILRFEVTLVVDPERPL